MEKWLAGGSVKHRWYKEQLPFLFLLPFALLGVAAATFFEVHFSVYRAVQLLFAITSFACIWGLFHVKLLPVAMAMWLFCFTWVRIWEQHPKLLTTHFSRYTVPYLMGWIGEEPKVGDKTIRFRFNVIGGVEATSAFSEIKDLDGYLQLSIEKLEGFGFEYGQVLMIPSDKIQQVSPPLNPGEFDYAGYLKKQYCWHLAYLDASSVLVIGNKMGDKLLAIAQKIRYAFVQKFERWVPHPEALAIASTLILGYRADLSPELMETFSATGTIHVLSVSGMHVVLVFWMMAKLLFWMENGKHFRWLRLVLLCTAIWFYALITGLSPSVLRAALMLTIVLIGEVCQKQPRSFNSISAAALFLLVIQPNLVYDLGFQLSFLAVFGIVFFSPYLQDYCAKIPLLNLKWTKPISDYSMMSLAAQAGAFPLATYYFHQFPVYFLIANLLVVLPASLIMYCGFALLVLPEWVGLNWVLEWVGKGLSWQIMVMNDVLEFIQNLPYAQVNGITISLMDCLMIYFVMIAMAFAVDFRAKKLIMLGVFGTFLIVCSITFSSIKKFSQSMLVIHSIRNQIALSVVHQGEAWIYSDLDSLNHPSIKYAVLPHLLSKVKRERINWLAAGEHWSMDPIHIYHNFLQWGSNRILIWDEKSFASKWRKQRLTSSEKRLAVNVLWLRNNPKSTLRELNQYFSMKMLLLDGSNSNRNIERFIKEAERMSLPYYVLKNNFAYVWVLDEES